MIRDWFKKNFADPQVVYLAVGLLLIFGGIFWFGKTLAPFLTSVVIAYLLNGLVDPIIRLRCPRLVATLLVYMLFVLCLLLIFFALIPMLSKQASQLVQQLPSIIGEGQKTLMQLPQQYPDFISSLQVQELISMIQLQLGQLGQQVVSLSLSSVVGLISILIYVILVPMMVFFLMKDRTRITRWVADCLPSENALAKQVWKQVDIQIGNYVRGKFWEVLIVWWADYVAFRVMGLPYAMLLSVLVGLSVLVPYVGAAVVTVPVIAVAWHTWGWSPDMIYLVSVYLVIQALDGTVLVPLLFSEVVNLHPVAIMVAVLFFGGVWGVLGVFFAIPLATLVQAVMVAWPRAGRVKTDIVSPS